MPSTDLMWDQTKRMGLSVRTTYPLWCFGFIIWELKMEGQQPEYSCEFERDLQTTRLSLLAFNSSHSHENNMTSLTVRSLASSWCFGFNVWELAVELWQPHQLCWNLTTLWWHCCLQKGCHSWNDSGPCNYFAWCMTHDLGVLHKESSVYFVELSELVFTRRIVLHSNEWMGMGVFDDVWGVLGDPPVTCMFNL
jgi:hypothetical protein